MTEKDITAVLRRQFSSQHSAFLSQVPNATGFDKTRTCDGLAMSLWPSKGLYLTGFEIKTTRSDWLREIQDHTKAEAFAKHCDFWYVACPTGVAKPEECPANWGIMHVSQHGCRVKKAATRREVREPLGPEMVAGLFRAMNRDLGRTAAAEEVSAAYDRGYKEGCKRGKDNQATDTLRAQKQLENLQRSVSEFEVASGLKIQEYNGKSLGEQVKALGAFRHAMRSVSAEKLRHQSAALKDLADAIESECKLLEESA